MASQDSTRWWLAAEALVAATVVACPLALGGAHELSFTFLCWGSFAALSCWTVGAWKHRRRVTWHPLFVLPLFLLGAALLSLVPLPEGLLRVLSPANAELRDFALVPLGLERARPITVDGPATFRAVLRILSFGALSAVVLQLARIEGPRRRLAMVVALTGALVALVGFGHLLGGAESLFGLHHFYGNVPFLSFFGNTNHLSAYLALSATVALALSLSASTREHAVGWGALAAVVAVAVFLSFSRGGVGTFVASWVVVGALALARRQGGLRGVLPWLVIGVTSLFAIALAAEPLFERLSSVSSVDRLRHTKLELWPMFFEGALVYGRAGMGLGAFELAFGPHQTTQLDVTFTHPENVVLQWASELGFLGAAVFFALVAVVGLRLARQTKGAVYEQTLLVAAGGALAHDLFDFSLELNAVPPALAVVLGLVAAREHGPAAEPRRAAVHRASLAIVVAIAVGDLVAWTKGFPTHRAAEEALAAVKHRGAAADQLRAAALPLIDRHPSDWVLYAMVAQARAAERAPRDTLAWVNRVLFLRPQDPGAHVSAARALLALDQPGQALLELKTAWRLGDERTLDQGLALAAKLDAWDRLLVDTPGLLSRLWERTRALQRPSDGRALLDAALVLAPTPEVEREARVLEVWQASLGGAPEDVLSRLEQLPPEARQQPELVVLRARTLAATARADEGIASLDAFARRTPAHLDVALALVDLLAKSGRFADAHATVERVRPFVTSPAARSGLFQTEAGLWEQEERWGRAIDALQTAARIEPTRADLHYRLAQLYERMGSLHSALDELRKGRVLDTPEGAKAQDSWAARLEAAMSHPVAFP